MGKDKVEINDGHYHEMMDRLYVQMDILDQYLLKHPVGEKHKEVRKPIVKAIVALLNAYQITGGIAHDKINKTKKKETNKRRNSKDDNK
jgi:hypothetical protein